jgi:enoyl-CoA hydratase/carnithine racemase
VESRVAYEKASDGVATVLLNRPAALNALDSHAKRELGEIWIDAASDDAVRAVVLAGAGEKAFCAGSDLKEMAHSGHSVSSEVLLGALPGAVAPFGKPVIAALHGYSVGMGLSLALHADIRLAAADAVLGFPEVKHGMLSAVSAVRVPRMIAPGRALELLLTGELISAADAERAGLVNRVVHADVRAEAAALARRIAALPAGAVQATVRLAQSALAGDVAAQRDAIARERAAVDGWAEMRAGAETFARGAR